MDDAVKLRMWRYKRRHGDFKRVFDSPEGRRVLADLRRFCLYDTTVQGGSSEQTHINIGQRNVFVHIRTVMKTDPETLEKQLDEADDGTS